MSTAKDFSTFLGHRLQDSSGRRAMKQLKELSVFFFVSFTAELSVRVGLLRIFRPCLRYLNSFSLLQNCMYNLANKKQAIEYKLHSNLDLYLSLLAGTYYIHRLLLLLLLL